MHLIVLYVEYTSESTHVLIGVAICTLAGGSERLGDLPIEIPPSPPPLPIFGNLFDVGLAGTPWDLMLQLEPKYGPVTRLQLPIAGDFYLVHDPAVRI